MPWNRSPSPWIVILACAPLLVAACGGATDGPTPPSPGDDMPEHSPSAEDDGEEPPAEGQIEVVGTLNDEGVECPAVRGDDGELYTLTGADLRGHSTGDRLRIRGTVAQMSFCMQGTTIAVESVERTGE